MNNITKTLLGSVLVLGSLFTGVTEANAATGIRVETKCYSNGVCYQVETEVGLCDKDGAPSRWDYPFTTTGETNYVNDYKTWKSTQPANCVFPVG